MQRRLRQRLDRRERGRERRQLRLRPGREEGQLAGFLVDDRSHGLRDSALDRRGRREVDPHEHARTLPLQLERGLSGCTELIGAVEPTQHPADRRPLVGLPLRIDRTTDDQAVDRARHRHVVEPQPLRLVLGRAGLLDAVVAEHAVAAAGCGVGDPEAEAAVGQAEDLVGRGRVAVAAGVGHYDDLELQPLRGVDRQQPDGVGALLLRDRVPLRRADRLLLLDKADEAFDIGAAQLLVRAREPRQLAQVCIAPAPVPLCEHGEVVVVVGDDPLAEALEREPRRGLREPVVALPEGAEKPRVVGVEIRRQCAFEAGEDRPPRIAPDQHQRVVGDADEGRREHADERLVVVAVLEQAQVREQVDDLLLAEVAAAGGAVGGKTGAAQLLLVPLGVRPGREEEDDLARGRGARVDELLDPPRDVLRLCAAPVDAGARVRRLVGHEQLDGRAEDRIGELAGRREWLKLLAELGPEEVIDDCEHLRPRAVVARQRQQRLRPGAALPEDLHVGVAEAVDRLELVADEEPLRVGSRQQVDQLALEPIRVLELVDHDRAEPQPLPLAQALVVAQQVTGVQLKVLEVERRLAVLRRRVLGREAVQELLQQVAILQRQLVERRLLDRLPRLLVARRPLAARPEAAEIEQPLGECLRLRERHSLRRRRPRRVGRVRIGRESARDVGQLVELSLEVRPLAQLEVELPAGGAKGLVHGRQHPPQATGAVGRQQLQPFGILTGAELVQRRLERLAADHAALAVVEDPEARVEPGRERVGLQQPQAEAVDGRDPGAVERAGQVVALELVQAGADPALELARCALGVGDHEHRLDVDPALADRLDEALDEYRRLAGAGACRDEDLPPRRDRRRLLLVGSPRRHARLIRHIRQRSHQAGQPSVPFGSCRTSPSRIRCASPRARSRAPSTWAQNASSSR